MAMENHSNRGYRQEIPPPRPKGIALGALLWRWLCSGVGILLAAFLVRGITYDDTASLVLVVILLSLANAFLKPVLVFFTLPFVLFTLGLGVLLINALLLWLVSAIVPGFHVDGFWSAVLGALLISLTSLVLGNLVVVGQTRPTVRVHWQGQGLPPPPPPRPRGQRGKKDDIIDI